MVKKLLIPLMHTWLYEGLYFHEGQITSFLLSNCLGNALCHSRVKRQNSKNIQSPLTELQFHKESLWNVYMLEKDCIKIFIYQRWKGELLCPSAGQLPVWHWGDIVH